MKANRIKDLMTEDNKDKTDMKGLKKNKTDGKSLKGLKKKKANKLKKKNKNNKNKKKNKVRYLIWNNFIILEVGVCGLGSLVTPSNLSLLYFRNVYR